MHRVKGTARWITIADPVSISKKVHFRPASETPLEWRFAGGPIVSPDLMLIGEVRQTLPIKVRVL